MNDLAREDLSRLCSYIFQNEEDDFAEMLIEDPDAFPGLTPEEIHELENTNWGIKRYMDLLAKAADCEANQHVYALAHRLHREFCKEPERIKGPCTDCGREEWDEDEGDETVSGTGHWFTPCPSDDCPSHDVKEPK